MSDAQTPTTSVRSVWAAIGRVLVLVLIALLVGTALFAVAGRLDWLEGWIISAVFLLYLAGGGIAAAIISPGQLEERATATAHARGLERLILLVVVILCVALIVVSALDAGRFRWSSMPLIVEVFGWLLLLPAVALPSWVGVVNTYASVVVRIQEDRGHYVIRKGPYRWVRHPMYVGMILMGISIPLALGSWWALCPGLALSVVFVLRTAQEDAVLMRDLAGYAEYAQQVRYRLFPYIW